MHEVPPAGMSLNGAAGVAVYSIWCTTMSRLCWHEPRLATPMLDSTSATEINREGWRMKPVYGNPEEEKAKVRAADERRECMA